MKKGIANYIILIATVVTMLTPRGGVFWYDDGNGVHKETYYNLKMTRVVKNAQNKGLEGEYWVREDGCKMFGDYIIVAADYNTHPYGSVVKTSRGEGIVLDTGEFAKTNHEQIDIATNWR